jgi:hypothetical protein
MGMGDRILLKNWIVMTVMVYNIIIDPGGVSCLLVCIHDEGLSWLHYYLQLLAP